MAGVFYARFIPPAKKDPASPQILNQAQKRKREEEPDGSVVTSTPTPSKKQKKSQNPPSDRSAAPRDTEGSEGGKHSRSVDRGLQETEGGKESVTTSNGTQAQSNDSLDKSGEGTKEKRRKRRDSGDHHDTTEVVTDTAVKADAADGDQQQDALNNNTQEDKSPKKRKKEKKKKKKQEEQQQEQQPDEDEEIAKIHAKHSRILSKFQKSAAIKSKVESLPKPEKDDAADETEKLAGEPVVAQGLEPLPQPEPAPQTDEKPTYSSLPAWLANPIRASADQRAKFSELGIDSKLLRTLEDNGYKEAFAVQSTVIPLLLQGPANHPGDLCISAATGSGKTLSYVLPLVTALEQTPVPRLRGLIVVPTRELVKQAREACELCATGTGLRIGTAVGNVAIKDEQRTLMRVDPIYDPHAFKVQQDMKLTGDDWMKLNLHDYISEAEGLNESLPGYINKPEPNVDILISTPGRLVDHIRFTKGFTLQHVQWLVIDEADRLLNESFQEWVDVVMNSLDAGKSSQAAGPAGKLLADLRLPLEKKEPRKVVLSATMTRDVTKLNSLRLVNPKLVVIGKTDKDTGTEEVEDGTSKAQEAESFTLPPTLKEFSVPVGDGSEKPLYLLQLLLSHIKVDLNRHTSDSSSDSEDSSSDDSSSEESDFSDSDSSDEDDESSSSSSSLSDSDSDSDESSSDESTDSSDASSVSSLSKSKAKPARNTVLIFTKSSESASRLSRLLSLLNPSLASRIGTIIKSNKSSASRKTLTAYRRGKISIIVATDRASRGLDLQSLRHVVNYDVPPSVTTYVHRVGRTARAGKEGSAWTLVAHREGRWFSNEIVKDNEGRITRSGNVERVNVKLDDAENLKSKYEAALDELELEVKADARGKAAKSKN